MGYASLQALRARGYGDDPDEWVNTYDPHREMLVIITMQQPSGTASYRLRMDVGVDEAVAGCSFSTSLKNGQ